MMRALTSVVITPAESRALVSLDDVREQLQIKSNDTAHDAWLTKVIARTSRQAERYCHRIFALQSYRDTFGSVTGNTGAPLQTGRAPIVTVDALTLDNGAQLADTDFTIDQPPGHLYRLGESSAWSATTSIIVDYSAGFDPIPDDVQQAVIELCVMEYRGRGRDPMLRDRETPGLGRESFWVGGTPGGSTLPGDIAGLLDPYCRGLIG
jgi:hypothetical protein